MLWSPLKYTPPSVMRAPRHYLQFPNRSSALEVPFTLIGMSGDRDHALLVASSGGHLAQLLALRPWWHERERTWVTFGSVVARSLFVGVFAVWAFLPSS